MSASPFSFSLGVNKSRQLTRYIHSMFSQRRLGRARRQDAAQFVQEPRVWICVCECVSVCGSSSLAPPIRFRRAANYGNGACLLTVLLGCLLFVRVKSGEILRARERSFWRHESRTRRCKLLLACQTAHPGAKMGDAVSRQQAGGGGHPTRVRCVLGWWVMSVLLQNSSVSFKGLHPFLPFCLFLGVHIRSWVSVGYRRSSPPLLFPSLLDRNRGGDLASGKGIPTRVPRKQGLCIVLSVCLERRGVKALCMPAWLPTCLPVPLPFCQGRRRNQVRTWHDRKKLNGKRHCGSPYSAGW